jgi:hypothetical protein
MRRLYGSNATCAVCRSFTGHSDVPSGTVGSPSLVTTSACGMALTKSKPAGDASCIYAPLMVSVQSGHARRRLAKGKSLDGRNCGRNRRIIHQSAPSPAGSRLARPHYHLRIWRFSAGPAPEFARWVGTAALNAHAHAHCRRSTCGRHTCGCIQTSSSFWAAAVKATQQARNSRFSFGRRGQSRTGEPAGSATSCSARRERATEKQARHRGAGCSSTCRSL